MFTQHGLIVWHMVSLEDGSAEVGLLLDSLG